MKNSKGFTLTELVIVLAIIAMLAAITGLYGRSWYYQYQLSNLLRSTQGTIRTARMQAITQGRDSAIIITSNAVDSATQSITTAAYKGNYQVVGPYLLTGTDTINWPKYFPSSYGTDTNPAKTVRVYYLMYDNQVYSFDDVSIGLLAPIDSFNIKFNSRGIPWTFSSDTPPAALPYKERIFRLQSKRLKHSDIFPVTVKKTGRLE